MDNGLQGHSEAEEGFLNPHAIKALKPIREERLMQSYLPVILRYKFLILIISIISVTASVYYTSKLPRLFSSSATIAVGTYIPLTDNPLSAILRDETQNDNYIDTQITLLGSLTAADTVLRKNPEIRDFILGPDHKIDITVTKDGNEVIPELPPEILRRYLGNLSFKKQGYTNIVRITAISENAEMTAKIANAHSKAFVEVVRQQHQETATAGFSFLKEREEEARAKIVKAEQALKDFAIKHEMGLDSERSSSRRLDSRMQNILNNLGSAALSRATVEAEIRELSAESGAERLAGDASSRAKYESLRSKQDELRYLKRFIKYRDHPDIVRLTREIEVLKESLELAARERVKVRRRALEGNIERETMLREEYEKLQGQFENQKQKQLDRSGIQLKYNALQSDYSSAKIIYQQILKRIEDVQLTAGAEQTSVSLRDKAYPPSSPFSPNKKFNIFLGLLFGPLVGIALAYILDFMDDTLKSIDQIERYLGLGVLGSIPQFTAIKLKKDSEEPDTALSFPSVSGKPSSIKNALVYPDSSYSESFRALRTILTHGTNTVNPRVILVAGGQPADGKSTVAVNLSLSYSKTPDKTLLLDADLRRPAIHSAFELSRNAPGLSDYLSGSAELKDVIHYQQDTGIFVLPAGSPCGNPSELLASARMKSLLSLLRERVDRIIIDTPPITKVADALIFAPEVDGVLFVIRAGRTPRPVAEFAIQRLAQVGTPVLGAVLNGVKRIGIYRAAEYYYGDEDYKEASKELV